MDVSLLYIFSLLSQCGDRPEGKVNYLEFLNNLKVDVHPGDLIGLSSQIVDNSSLAELKRQSDQFIRF